MIRSKDKAIDSQKRGVDEIAVGDLSDEASLRKAAEGVDAILHMNPAFAPNEAEHGISMVRAALDSGVRKFVFSGVIHPSISKMSNHAGKRPVEEALYESGLIFTVLQPTMFMQTLANGWKEVVKHNSFSLPFSKYAKACYVDYWDVAEVAAIGFLSDKLDHGTFELSSAGMVDRIQLSGIMSKALGRTIEARQPTFQEWAKMAQIPSGPVMDGMRIMYANYDHYRLPGGNPVVLRAILEREPRTLEAFIRELANSGRRDVV